MKKRIIVLLLCFISLCTTILYGQCPTQTLIISDQADIDNFPINYPNCVDMMNNGLVLQGPGINDLSGLSSIKSLNHFVLSGTPNITNLDGIQGLENVNENIIAIGANFTTFNLPNLVFIKYLNISSCDVVTDISLPLVQFAEFIEIGPCVSLETISCESISYMSISPNSEYAISIYGSDNLESVSFPNLQATEGTVFITQNNQTGGLETLNFSSLTSIVGRLLLANLAIQDLSGFAMLEQIGDDLVVYDCEQLLSLAGLESLMDFGGSLELEGNSSLSFCSIPAVCSHLEEPGNSSNIFVNVFGCNSEQEILDLCNNVIDCNEVDFQIVSTTPTACPPDSLQPDVCLNVCPYKSQVFTVPDFEGENIQWTVLGAENYEVVGRECIVEWGGPGSGLVSATAEIEEGCQFTVNVADFGNFAYYMEVAGGTPPYTYELVGPNGIVFVEPFVQFPEYGTWILIITDAVGCVENHPLQFPYPQSDCDFDLNIFASVTNANNPTTENGAIDITILNGQPPYTYQWQQGGQTEDIFGLSSGDYWVTVTDANGCKGYKTVEVNDGCSNTETLVIDPLFCDDLSSFTFNILGPDQILTTTVIGPDFFVSHSLENNFIEPGLYEIYVETDVCKYLRTIDVQLYNSVSPLITNESECGSCNGSIDLGNIEGAFLTGWSNGETSNVIQDLCAGIYTAYFVSTINGTNCSADYEIKCGEDLCSFDLSVCIDILEEIEANMSTVPEAINGSVNICAGQTVYLESESINAETHTWDFGNGETASGNSTEFTYEIAGSYIVELIARNECFCADTTTINVNVEQAIIPQLDCVGSICENTEVTYTTDASCASYAWQVTGDGTITNGGDTNDDFITIDWGAGPLGTISLSVDNCTENYCIFENITQIPIIGNNDLIKGADEVCKGDLEVYNITNYGGSDFFWEVSQFGTIVNGQGTNSVSVQWTDLGIPPNSQWVRVTYENCYLECGGTSQLEVNILDEYFFSGPIEICQNESATYTAEQFSGGSAILDWELQNQFGEIVFTATASATFSFNANAPVGVYTLLAAPTDGTGFCSDNYQTFINILEIPPAVNSISGETEICLGQNYSYTAISSETGTSFIWEIQDGTTTIPKVGRVINVEFNSSGPYNLSVVQAENSDAACQSLPLQLTVNTIQPLQILGGQDHCVESISTFTTTNYDNIDYEWNVNPTVAATIVEGQNTNTVEIFWHSQGDFSVTLNACGYTDDYAVEVNPAPSPIVNHPIEICPNESATVSVTSTFASYEWKDENGTVISNAAQPNLSAGYYELIVADEIGCIGNTTFNIEPIPISEVEISSPNLTTYCPIIFPVPVLYAMIADPPFDYQWHRNGIPIPSATNATYSPPSGESGAYTVEATNQEGCAAFSNIIDIVSSCDPVTGPPQELQCVGVDVSFDIENTIQCKEHKYNNTSPNSVPGTVNWFFGFPDVEGTATGENVSYEFQRSGYYLVVMVADHMVNGNVETCGLGRLDLVPVSPNFAVLPGCIGADILFEDLSTHISGDGVESWLWDFGDPASGISNSSTVANPAHQYSNPGTYTVSLTITSENDCESTVTKTVEVQDFPSPSFNLPIADCQEVPLNFVANIGNEVVDVIWDFGDPSSGDANISNVANTYHEYSTPGIYTISLTAKTLYGCEAVFTEQVTVQPNTMSGITTMSPISPICEGTSTVLSAPAGGQNYAWSNNTNGANILVSDAGEYTVTVTDANGCIYIPPPVIVDILPVPEGEIRVVEYDEFGQPILFFYDTYSICQGEDVFLEINEVDGYTYQWTNGQSGTTLEYSVDRDNELQEGTYEFDVVITDSNTGCTSQVGPFTVNVNAQPGPIELTSDPAGFICDSNPVTISIQNYDPDFTYIWNTGTIDATAIVVEVPGTYYVRGVNENGCQTLSNEIVVNKGPDINRIPSGCHKQCTPDTLCLPNMPTIVSWQWYFNDVAIPAPEGNVNELVATESGDYFVEMVDEFGCTATSGLMSLDLFIGLGTVNGMVYFDVNENGFIDGPDTLMSNQTIYIEGDNYTSLANSNMDGIYSFNDVESVNYTLYFDSLNLPNNWSVIESVQQVELVGCDDEAEINWLVTSQCSAQFSSEILQACTDDFVTYNGVDLFPNEVVDVVLLSLAGCDSTVTVTVEELFPTIGTLNVQACAGTSYDYNGTSIPAGSSDVFQLQNIAGCDSTLTVVVEEVLAITDSISFEACTNSSYEFDGVEIPAGSTEEFMYTTSEGCDSIVMVFVDEIESYFSMTEIGGCIDEVFEYNDQQFTAGDSVVQNFTSTLGCDSIVQLNFYAFPDFEFEYITEIICPDEAGSIDVNMMTGPSATYLFSIDGMDFQVSSEFNNLPSGGYEIYVQDEQGCVKSISANIPVYDNLSISAEDKTLSCDIDSVELVAELLTGPIDDLLFIWPDGSTVNSFFATEPGTYLLQTSNICQEITNEITVFPAASVLEDYLYIPNVFSPNGDGINDEFILYPAADVIIHDFEINIFNRWGEALYSSNDITVGWNGQLKNGNFNPGVHVWFLNMEITYCGERLEILEKGDITVIR